MVGELFDLIIFVWDFELRDDVVVNVEGINCGEVSGVWVKKKWGILLKFVKKY